MYLEVVFTAMKRVVLFFQQLMLKYHFLRISFRLKTNGLYPPKPPKESEIDMCVSYHH